MTTSPVQPYDVIIAGAGPAGLSVASELSTTLRVLVFDRKADVTHTDKSWFVPAFVLSGHDELRPFFFPGVRRFLTHTFSDAHTAWHARLDGGYAYVNDRELLDFWKTLILAHGSEIRLRCAYLRHTVQADQVTVQTTQGTFRAKLLIDAMGSESPIRTSTNDCYWWSVYGAIVEHPNGLPDNMQVGDYMMWETRSHLHCDYETSLQNGRPVFEYEVLDEQTSFVLILYLRTQKMPRDQMRDEFLQMLHANALYRKASVTQWKLGWYPSGRASTYARDRVAFIGDAGGWTMPCGWGLAYILRYYTFYAAQLVRAVQRDMLAAPTLRRLFQFDAATTYQITVNQLATHLLAHASVSQLDRFIGFFQVSDSLLCEQFFTVSVPQRELLRSGARFLAYFGWLELLNALPLKDLTLLEQLFRTFVGVKRSELSFRTPW